jgi:hypothetical protein
MLQFYVLRNIYGSYIRRRYYCMPPCSFQVTTVVLFVVKGKIVPLLK